MFSLKTNCFKNEIVVPLTSYSTFIIQIQEVQVARAVEYTDYISAEG